jgi:DNA-binding transcriptional MocR family regulator
MTGALALHLPELALPHVPSGGYHLWLKLPDDTGEAALSAAALRAGVAVTPGRPYFSAEPPAGHLRLSFAAVAGTGEITEGVRRLRAARDEVRGGI